MLSTKLKPEWKSKCLWLMIFSSIFLLSACSGESKEGIFVPEEEEIIVTETDKPEEIMVVEIKGEVKKPGVYAMEPGSRLNDLLNTSGGALPEANLRNVNLAMRIADGDSFYIPSEEESEESAGTSVIVGGGEAEGKIDLNNASREELMSVTGIGPSTADNILAYREENGRFSSVDDLINVNRIGEKTLEKLRDFFIVR